MDKATDRATDAPGIDDRSAALSPERHALLARRRTDESARTSHWPLVRAIRGKEAVELSFAQKHYWLLDRLLPSADRDDATSCEVQRIHEMGLSIVIGGYCRAGAPAILDRERFLRFLPRSGRESRADRQIGNATAQEESGRRLVRAALLKKR